MEKKLKTLFDFQMFRENERLSKLIQETESSKRELSLDELDLVSAAGDIFERKETEQGKNERGEL